MRVIYLSPHFDDAVLSAGGLIHDEAAQGDPTEIWTLMGGIPTDPELSEFAVRMHAEWGTTTASQTVRLRRREDRQAARALGARAVHFRFLDCLYRRNADGRPLYAEALRAPIDPYDEGLPRRIAAALRR